MTSSNGQGGSALTLDDRKRSMRAASLRLMERCDPVAGQAVAGNILAHLRLVAPIVVAGFYPLNRELDVTPLLRQLRQAGHVVALPRTPARGLPLSFHRWANDEDLRPDRFATTTSCGPVVAPDLILVPLLAFDRRGHRLGYGGGFYDRTIAGLPGVHTIGCAYAALECPEVPSGTTDMPLACIATEREFITIESTPCASSS